MNDWKNDPEQAGIENILRSLKKPFHLDETFELRVMSAVHSGSSPDSEPWWTKRYTLRFTALGGLVMAASIAAVVMLASMVGKSMVSNQKSTVSQQSAVSSRTVHFILVNDNANQVYLVGDFNNWSKTKTPLKRAVNQHAWTVSIPLGEGKHEYAFIVADENGEHWVADPLSMKVQDEFGTESSIVRVGPTSS
jgi:hypothetical protein